MSGRFRDRLSLDGHLGPPVALPGGVVTAYMVLLYVAVGLGPAGLVLFGGFTVPSAIETTVLLVGAAYLAGLVVVVRYF